MNTINSKQQNKEMPSRISIRKKTKKLKHSLYNKISYSLYLAKCADAGPYGVII